MVPRGGADVQKCAVKMHARIPTNQRSIASFSFAPQKPAPRGFDSGGLHFNGRQRRCSRDISADLCFWFHRKSHSLDNMHREDFLLVFLTFTDVNRTVWLFLLCGLVGKRNKNISKSPEWAYEDVVNSEIWMSRVRMVLFSFKSGGFLYVLKENVEDTE